MAIHNLILLSLALATRASAISDKIDMSLITKLGEKKLSDILEAHALLGSLAWVIIIPLGAIVFALLKVPRLFWIHSTIQTIGLLCLIPSFTLGVIIGISYGKLYNNTHTIMGTIVFGIALFQPVWGILQHRIYKKTGETSWWGLLHRWVGRITITAAMINGGLGFILTKGYGAYSKGGLVAYIVASSVMWSIYVAAATFETVRNMKMEASGKSGERNNSGSSISVEEKGVEHRWSRPWKQRASI